MSAADVQEHFIAPMQVIFGDPPGDSPAEAIMVYVRPLSHREPDLLRRLAEHYQLTAKRRTWPMPADVLEQAGKIAGEMRAAERAKTAKVEPSDGQRARFADDAILSEEGVRAAKRGYISAFHAFCERHCRLPDQREIDKLADECRRAEAAIIAIGTEDELEPARLPVGKLAEALRSRRDFLAAKVFDWAKENGIDVEHVV